MAERLSSSKLFEMAQHLGVSTTKTDIDVFAGHLTGLADDDVIEDEFEDVVVALVRCGKLSTCEAIETLGYHFDETTCV